MPATPTRPLPLACAAALALAAALAPCAALAQAPAAPPYEAQRAPGKLLEVSFGLVHFDYEEREGGVFLDGETGFVPALGVGFEVDGEQLFGRFTAKVAKGTVDYDGHVQSADANFNGLDAKTESGAGFVQGELQVGAFLDRGQRLAAFAALGGRRWTREIHSAIVTSPYNGQTSMVSGLDETYGWFELQAGIRGVVVQTPRARVALDARLVRTASPSMTVTLPGAGDVTLDLGARTGWRVGGTAQLELGASTARYFTAGAFAEGYAFDKSAVDPTYLIYEPSSTTVNVGVEVGLGFRL